MEAWLRRHFRFKEIGWAEIGETFTRFTLVRTPWFTVYLHKLDAPQLHPQCHDHPWHFWAVILSGGYTEHTARGVAWRGPGSVLYRPARFAHNVVTRGVGWSVILASRKVREWGFLACDPPGHWLTERADRPPPVRRPLPPSVPVAVQHDAERFRAAAAGGDAGAAAALHALAVGVRTGTTPGR